MVAEQRQDADAEHCRHEKQEQDVEFGVSVRQLVLAEETGENQRKISDKFSTLKVIYGTRRNKTGRGRTNQTIITGQINSIRVLLMPRHCTLITNTTTTCDWR